MRRYFILFLVSLYSLFAFVPTVFINDLLKISSLANHYELHQQNNPSISFAEFFTLHYSNQYKQHQSEHDHSHLPFKSQSNHYSNLSVVTCAEYISQFEYSTNSDFSFEFFQKKSTYFFDNRSIPSPFLQSIWQPPKYS